MHTTTNRRIMPKIRHYSCVSFHQTIDTSDSASFIVTARQFLKAIRLAPRYNGAQHLNSIGHRNVKTVI
jgi:hypothetical protein